MADAKRLLHSTKLTKPELVDLVNHLQDNHNGLGLLQDLRARIDQLDGRRAVSIKAASELLLILISFADGIFAAQLDDDTGGAGPCYWASDVDDQKIALEARIGGMVGRGDLD